jgi:hypothetical protein
VIATSKFLPSLFFEFLHEVMRSFSSHAEANDTFCRFTIIKSLVGSWYATGPSAFQIYYPFESFALDVSRPESFWTGFNYTPILPNISQVWKSLLGNDGVLVVAPTPDVASTTAIACMSLLGPIRYRDERLLYTERGDPRLERIRQFKLIATTDYSLVSELPFGAVVRVTGAEVAQSGADLFAQYRALTLKHYTAMMEMMDLKLLDNPYNDILERPLNWRDFRIADGIVTKLLDDIQKTETFKVWRKKQITREQTRTGFLSVPPSLAIPMVPIESCQKVIDALSLMKTTFLGDHHLQKVIDRHIRGLGKTLSKAMKKGRGQG